MTSAIKRFFLLDTASPRNAAMEGLRAYAVLLIFLVHSLPNYALVFRHVNFDAYAARSLPSLVGELSPIDLALLFVSKSQFGVELFFLLSGFLICRIVSSTKQRFSYGSFLRKRFLRIYPAFLISLLISTVLSVHWNWVKFEAAAFCENLLLLNGLNGVAGINVPAYNCVTWSLFYEFAFYLVFPLLFWLMPKPRAAAFAEVHPMLLLMLVLLSFVWLPRFSMFYFGVLVGMTPDDKLRRVAAALPVSLVLGAYLATTLGFRLLPYNHFAFVPWYGAATSLLFVKVCFGDNALNRFFARLPLRLVGNISYSFYLIHLVAIGCTTMWLAKYLVGLPMAASLPLFLVAAFALALVFTVALFTAGERWYFGFAQHAQAQPAVAGSANSDRRLWRGRRALPAAGGVLAALSALIAVAGFLWPGWGLLSTRRPGKQELLWSLGKQGRTQFEFDRAGDAEPVFVSVDGVLRISIPAGYEGKWMVVSALDVAEKPVAGHHFAMCAQCTTDSGGPNVQLGVFDGCDKGSPAVAAPEGAKLEYECTAANPKDVSQFKINIFPQVARRSDVVIKNWDIRTY